MVNNKGFMEGIITMNCAEHIKEGDIVTCSGNNSLSDPAPGDSFLGIVKNVRNGIAAVQIKGYAKVPVAEGVGLGVQHVAIGDDIILFPATKGREIIILSIDYDTQIAEIIM